MSINKTHSTIFFFLRYLDFENGCYKIFMTFYNAVYT